MGAFENPDSLPSFFLNTLFTKLKFAFYSLNETNKPSHFIQFSLPPPQFSLSSFSLHQLRLLWFPAGPPRIRQVIALIITCDQYRLLCLEPVEYKSAPKYVFFYNRLVVHNWIRQRWQRTVPYINMFKKKLFYILYFLHTYHMYYYWNESLNQEHI